MTSRGGSVINGSFMTPTWIVKISTKKCQKEVVTMIQSDADDDKLDVDEDMEDYSWALTIMLHKTYELAYTHTCNVIKTCIHAECWCE